MIMTLLGKEHTNSNYYFTDSSRQHVGANDVSETDEKNLTIIRSSPNGGHALGGGWVLETVIENVEVIGNSG